VPDLLNTLFLATALSSFSSTLPLDVDHTRRCYFRTVAVSSACFLVLARVKLNAMANRCRIDSANRSSSKRSDRFSFPKAWKNFPGCLESISAFAYRCKPIGSLLESRESREKRHARSNPSQVRMDSSHSIRDHAHRRVLALAALSTRRDTDFSRPSPRTRSYSKLPARFAKLHRLASTGIETNSFTSRWSICDLLRSL